MEWNTDDYELGVTHDIQCRAYDTRGNYQDSESYNLFVDITFIKSFSRFRRGRLYDLMDHVQQTSDGGYILTGGVGENPTNIWLIKTDKYRNIEWDHTYYGMDVGAGSSVKQTSDGGFIITGILGCDLFLLKTDSQGFREWTQTFGGNSCDWGSVVEQTVDGGYVIAGGNNSSDNRNEDVWIIKTDNLGNEEWNKIFGTNYAYSWRTAVRQTPDGGYITYLGGGHGLGRMDDVKLIKLRSNGEEEWSLILGGTYDDWFFDIKVTSDEGYIATGFSSSRPNYRSSIWLVKVKKDGSVEWEKYFDGLGGTSVNLTIDGGYIVSGANKHESEGTWKICLIKTDSFGNEEWVKTFPDYNGNGHAVQQTTDEGYLIAGTDSQGFVLIKTNSDGNATNFREIIE